MAHIKYRYHLLQLVNGPEESLETYKKIQELLLLFKHISPTKEEALKSIEKISPQAADAFRDIIKKEGREWLNTLIQLVTLFILLQTTYNPHGNEDKTKDKFNEYLRNENKDLKAQIKKDRLAERKFEGLPPKVKCPCKSGKRFKNCHGRTKT